MQNINMSFEMFLVTNVIEYNFTLKKHSQSIWAKVIRNVAKHLFFFQSKTGNIVE